MYLWFTLNARRGQCDLHRLHTLAFKARCFTADTHCTPTGATGWSGRGRTCDQWFNRPSLYLLSYTPRVAPLTSGRTRTCDLLALCQALYLLSYSKVPYVYGGGGRTRTCDSEDQNLVLYQLSYSPVTNDTQASTLCLYWTIAPVSPYRILCIN